MKPGFKTTEFWLSLIAMMVSFMMASGMFAEGSQGMSILGYIGGALAAMGYSVSRGIAKRNP